MDNHECKIRGKLREFKEATDENVRTACHSDWFYDHARWHYDIVTKEIDDVRLRSELTIGLIGIEAALLWFVADKSGLMSAPLGITGLLAIGGVLILLVSGILMGVALWPKVNPQVSPPASLMSFRLGRVGAQSDAKDAGELDAISRQRMICEFTRFGTHVYLSTRIRHRYLSYSIRVLALGVIVIIIMGLSALIELGLSKEDVMAGQTGILLENGMVSIPAPIADDLGGSGERGGEGGDAMENETIIEPAEPEDVSASPLLLIEHADGTTELSDPNAGVEAPSNSASGSRGGSGGISTKGPPKGR